MPLHKFFFYLFLLSLPTQLGRHWWPDWSFVWGLRVDYLAPTVYLSDILLGLTLVTWLGESLLQKVQRYKGTEMQSKKNKKPACWQAVWLPSCILLLFLVLNFQVATSPPLWLYKLVKLGELVLLGIYVTKTTKTSADFKRIVNLLLIGAVFESGLAIVQFIKQSSIGGIFWWLGERTFNIATPGIAKISILNPLTYSQTLFLRPYGTFSHPNSLAGYLLLILTLVGLDLHARLPLPAAKGPGGQGYATHQHLNKPKDWIGAAKRIYTDYSFKFVLYSLLFVSFILTFSRSAWLVGLVLLVLGNLGNLRSLGKEKKILSLFLLLLSFIFYLLSFIYTSSDPAGLQKRWELTLASWQMIKTSPLIGIGLGHFIPKLVEFPQKGQIFWLQPVHNIFLLVMAETGLTGLVGFLGILGATYKRLVYSMWYRVYSIKRKRKLKKYYILHTTYYILLSLTAILLTGLTDHYWLTLPQNQLLFALILGLCWANLTPKS